jgi:transposase
LFEDEFSLSNTATVHYQWGKKGKQPTISCKQRQRERQTHHSKIIMVVDNVRFHHAKLLKKWLINNTKLELVYLPPYSPELNPIERAWWYMRKKITHNRYVKTLKERKVVFWKMFSHFQQPNDELLRVCEINY